MFARRAWCRNGSKEAFGERVCYINYQIPAICISPRTETARAGIRRTVDLNPILARRKTPLGIIGRAVGVNEVDDVPILLAGDEGEGEEVIRHPEAGAQIRLGYYSVSDSFLSSMVSVWL